MNFPIPYTQSSWVGAFDSHFPPHSSAIKADGKWKTMHTHAHEGFQTPLHCLTFAISAAIVWHSVADVVVVVVVYSPFQLELFTLVSAMLTMMKVVVNWVNRIVCVCVYVPRVFLYECNSIVRMRNFIAKQINEIFHVLPTNSGQVVKRGSTHRELKPHKRRTLWNGMWMSLLCCSVSILCLLMHVTLSGRLWVSKECHWLASSAHSVHWLTMRHGRDGRYDIMWLKIFIIIVYIVFNVYFLPTITINKRTTVHTVDKMSSGAKLVRINRQQPTHFVCIMRERVLCIGYVECK